MIKIIPFNDLFNPVNIEKLDLGSSCFINNLSLVEKLMNVEMPIKNKRIAIKNILEFLHYVDEISGKYYQNLVPIKQTKIVSFFGNAKNYKQYLTILSDLEVMTDVPYNDGTFYKVGSLFKHYQLHNKYVNDTELALVIFEEDKRPVFSNEIADLDKRYIATIKKLEIDLPKAIYAEILYHQKNKTDINDLKTRVNRVFYTKRKKYIKMGQKVNRVYHSFSNISKVSRQHLNIPLSNIDIVNCQPLLLVAYLISNNLSIDSNYISDCESGLFYERFITKKLDRDTIKRHLYKSIFFDFKDRFKVNKRFKELYPQTWDSLQRLKETGVALAGLLQNIEADLFNNLIPQKSKHYFTLFDSIYFDNVLDLHELETYIKNYFNKLGINVTTKKDLIN